jgi:hypothetical protein
VGKEDVLVDSRDESSASFREALLRDLRALEQMLRTDALESDAVRIGAEQEVFLIDRAYRPAPIASQVLEQLADSRFTNEIGKFNLEVNVPPRSFNGGCLHSLEAELNGLLERASLIAQAQVPAVGKTGPAIDIQVCSALTKSGSRRPEFTGRLPDSLYRSVLDRTSVFGKHWLGTGVRFLFRRSVRVDGCQHQVLGRDAKFLAYAARGVLPHLVRDVKDFARYDGGSFPSVVHDKRPDVERIVYALIYLARLFVPGDRQPSVLGRCDFNAGRTGAH